MKKCVVLFSIAILCCMAFVPGGVPGKTEKIALSKENPIQADMQGKIVSLLAEVNGKYLQQPTRHGVVFFKGKNGDKSVFRAYAGHKDLYDSLTKIGLKPGNNMTMDNKETTFVQGDLLDVMVSWEGGKKAYRLDEVISDSNKKPFQIRFGGNLQSALKHDTGCLVCLDSCPVGILSNAAYTYGAVEKRKEVEFRGNNGILPKDGTPVVITIKAK